LNLGRSIVGDLNRQSRWRGVYRRMQAEAAARPESKQVQTPVGSVWMSPIEVQLYHAMLQERLNPYPQFYIQGYYADFAFPDVGIAVEADGAVHQDPARHEHDRKRDWILRRAGWTVMRFHGTTIYHKASNCAYVIKKEVEGRRTRAALRAKELERRRQARREALRRPFRKIREFLFRKP
jgi:very-short-patch-repair endonuclease